MTFQNLFFIDFDGTLFSTELFWSDVRKTCSQQLSIPETTFLDTYKHSQSFSTVYDIDTHLKLLGISREKIISVFAYVFSQKSYMFQDVIPFMNNHKDDTLVILTQGVEWFQQEKIASLPIRERKVRTIVTNYKKRLFIENTVDFNDGVQWEGSQYQSLTFIDNMADAFLPAKESTLFRQYRIRRWGVDTHANEETQSGSMEITTLLDIT